MVVGDDDNSVNESYCYKNSSVYSISTLIERIKVILSTRWKMAGGMFSLLKDVLFNLTHNIALFHRIVA